MHNLAAVNKHAKLKGTMKAHSGYTKNYLYIKSDINARAISIIYTAQEFMLNLPAVNKQAKPKGTIKACSLHKH